MLLPNWQYDLDGCLSPDPFTANEHAWDVKRLIPKEVSSRSIEN